MEIPNFNPLLVQIRNDLFRPIPENLWENLPLIEELREIIGISDKNAYKYLQLKIPPGDLLALKKNSPDIMEKYNLFELKLKERFGDCQYFVLVDRKTESVYVIHPEMASLIADQIEDTLLALLEQRIKEGYDLEFVRDDSYADRIVKGSEIIDGKYIKPTSADTHYYSKYDIPSEIKIKGVYTGDPAEWLPVLIHDTWIIDTDDLWVVEINTKGFFVLNDTKMKYGGEFSNDVIDEGFIISEKPIPIESKRKITEEEIQDAEDEINERMGYSEEGEEEY